MTPLLTLVAIVAVLAIVVTFGRDQVDRATMASMSEKMRAIEAIIGMEHGDTWVVYVQEGKTRHVYRVQALNEGDAIGQLLAMHISPEHIGAASRLARTQTLTRRT
jgi:hypothetical protein